MADIEDELRGYILTNYFFSGRRALGNADSFMELGIIDSTGVLELVSYLEERYGITIEMDELVPDNLDSINSLAKFVHRKLGAQTPSSPVPSAMASDDSAPAGSNV